MAVTPSPVHVEPLLHSLDQRLALAPAQSLSLQLFAAAEEALGRPPTPTSSSSWKRDLHLEVNQPILHAFGGRSVPALFRLALADGATYEALATPLQWARLTSDEIEQLFVLARPHAGTREVRDMIENLLFNPHTPYEARARLAERYVTAFEDNLLVGLDGRPLIPRFEGPAPDLEKTLLRAARSPRRKLPLAAITLSRYAPSTRRSVADQLLEHDTVSVRLAAVGLFFSATDHSVPRAAELLGWWTSEAGQKELHHAFMNSGTIAFENYITEDDFPEQFAIYRAELTAQYAGDLLTATPANDPVGFVAMPFAGAPLRVSGVVDAALGFLERSNETTLAQRRDALVALFPAVKALARDLELSGEEPGRALMAAAQLAYANPEELEALLPYFELASIGGWPSWQARLSASDPTERRLAMRDFAKETAATPWIALGILQTGLLSATDRADLVTQLLVGRSRFAGHVLLAAARGGQPLAEVVALLKGEAQKFTDPMQDAGELFAAAPLLLADPAVTGTQIVEVVQALMQHPGIGSPYGDSWPYSPYTKGGPNVIAVADVLRLLGDPRVANDQLCSALASSLVTNEVVNPRAPRLLTAAAIDRDLVVRTATSVAKTSPYDLSFILQYLLTEPATVIDGPDLAATRSKAVQTQARALTETLPDELTATAVFKLVPTSQLPFAAPIEDFDAHAIVAEIGKHERSAAPTGDLLQRLQVSPNLRELTADEIAIVDAKGIETNPAYAARDRLSMDTFGVHVALGESYAALEARFAFLPYRWDLANAALAYGDEAALLVLIARSDQSYTGYFTSQGHGNSIARAAIADEPKIQLAISDFTSGLDGWRHARLRSLLFLPLDSLDLLEQEVRQWTIGDAGTDLPALLGDARLSPAVAIRLFWGALASGHVPSTESARPQVGRLFDALMARTDLQSHEREDLARGLLWFAKQK